MKTSVVSVYDLDHNQGRIVDQDLEVFDAEAYSRFKYGDANAARQYAGELCTAMLVHLDEIDPIDELVVTSSAFKTVPTAAYAIKEAFVPILGAARPDLHIVNLKIDREVVRDTDYSNMTLEERQRASRSNGLSIPAELHESLEGSTLLAIDDIRITGSHEEALSDLLGAHEIGHTIFGYVAVLDAEIAEAYPQTEFDLNHAVVKGLGDVIDIIRSGQFMLNARTCKFLLSQEPDKLCEVLEYVDNSTLSEIWTAMLDDGYSHMPQFAAQFERLQNVLFERARPTPAELSTTVRD